MLPMYVFDKRFRKSWHTPINKLKTIVSDELQNRFQNINNNSLIITTKISNMFTYTT